MTTRFNVNEKVIIQGKVLNIEIDENGTFYELEIYTCTGFRTLTFKEDQILSIFLEESDGIKT